MNRNGKLVDRTDSEDVIDLTEQVAIDPYHDVNTLNELAYVVSLGRRDCRAVERIVQHYGIANDAGIAAAIADETLKSVRSIIGNRDRRMSLFVS
jgi:hypothetical protein